MKRIFLLISFIFSLSSFSQTNTLDKSYIQAKEAELKSICSQLFSPDKKDAEKHKLNQELLQKFDELLNENNSFENYQFDSLKNDIGILNSPDVKFRIINWNVPKDDGTQEYYGFIQEKFRQVKKKGLLKKQIIDMVQLYPLIDKSLEIKNPENTISDNKKWYGMLYYKIILKKTKTKTYYTLLGWDGNDKFSQKKIIDVLTFDNMGIPKFGADIFIIPKKYPKRIVFEYSSTCTMSLKFSEKKDSIVFDHLSPTQPQFDGVFQYYCSDMSYDGLGFKHGKWNYGADVKAVNEKDEKDMLYGDPHDRTPGHDQSNNIIKREKRKKKK